MRVFVFLIKLSWGLVWLCEGSREPLTPSEGLLAPSNRHKKKKALLVYVVKPKVPFLFFLFYTPLFKQQFGGMEKPAEGLGPSR